MRVKEKDNFFQLRTLKLKTQITQCSNTTSSPSGSNHSFSLYQHSMDQKNPNSKSSGNFKGFWRNIHKVSTPQNKENA